MSKITRRHFISTSAAATAAASYAVPRFAIGQEGTSPNEKLSIACIGTANRAAANIDGVQGEHIAAICDVDSTYLDRAKTRFPDANTYADYRELIDKEGDKIDAVVVATADHHHIPASIRALKAGKHVYCEKPVAHTVYEARLIANAAKETGLATQMGTQIHAGDNYRRVVELVQSGAIGDITDVHCWCGKAWGGSEMPREDEICEPPKNLDWDLWIGPAPMRPFATPQKYPVTGQPSKFSGYHPAQWRRWWDFGSGTLGDMACHIMDLPFWALGLRYPTTCESEGPEVSPETCPLGLIMRYEYAKGEKHGPLNLTWYDGNLTPSEIAGERVPGMGVMFVGTEGKLFADYGRHKLFPVDKYADFQPPEPTIPASIGHHAEWIKACKDGSPTTCNFDYSATMTEAVLLGSVAYRVGQKLEWDAENLKATNCPEADKFINKEYRKGWEVDI